MISETLSNGELDIETVLPEEAAPEVDDVLPANPPEPEADDQEKALVADLCQWAKETREFWNPVFCRIQEEMEFNAGCQWPEQLPKDERYVANITRRIVNFKVASIYAKNPKTISRVRPKQDFVLWDGDPNSITMAQMVVRDPVVVQAADTGDPQAMQVLLQANAILADYENGMTRRQMVKRWGRTLELVYDHQCDQQAPRFKSQMKNLVRRALTARVGWVKLGYRRQGETVNTTTPQANTPERMKGIAQRLNAIAGQEADNEDKVRQEVELMNQSLAAGVQAGVEKLVDEGLVFDFPPATSILVDRCTTSLRTLDGAHRVAQEYLLTPEEVERRYGVNVKGSATPYNTRGKADEDNRMANKGGYDKLWPDEARCCVWEVYDIDTQLKYVVCDGYDAFLEEPEMPLPRLSRFWPIFGLVFNEITVEENDPEKDVTCYAPSDVRLLMHMQRELNRSREALRDHRIQNRPVYVGGPQLTETDAKMLASGLPSGAVIRLEGLAQGQSVDQVLQQIKKAAIDPAVYATQHVMEDVLMTVGAQQANLGPTTEATATEVSVAEGSRIQSGSSDVDDLDDFLTELARAAGEMLLQEMTPDVVKRIAGPGAAWPSTPQEVHNSELFLECEASGSGRPNRALEMAVLREILPLLMQLPNINADAVVRHVLRVWDDRIEVEEFYQKGAPSIISQNRSQSPEQVAQGVGAEGKPSDGNETVPGEKPPNANDPAKSQAEQTPTTAGMPARFQNKTAHSAAQPPA